MLKLNLFFYLLFVFNLSYAQLDVLKNVSSKANSFINVKKTQSDKDISDGLTEALKISVIKSCNNASQENGFYKNDNIKIPFPSKINKVKKACLNIGLDKLVLDFEYTMNQTAELASIEASEIIVKAVLSLRFNDAIQILNGSENSATLYLKDKSFDNLYTTFYPIVKNEMDNTGVQIMLDLILKRYGKAEPINEKSKNGNFVKIDFEGFLNGEKFDGGEASDYSLELGSNTMIPGFEEQIVGMKSSETKEIEVTFPEDYQAENLKGQKVIFKINMKEVSELKLPNLDEEFFKTINMDVKTKEEFEKKVEEQLQTDLTASLKTKTKQRIFDAFESSNQIDIPKSMIISEANNLRKNTVQQMGLDINKLEEDKFPLENFTDNALKRVRLGVLINKLIEENNIAVDKDSLKKEIEDKSKSFKDPEQYVNWIYGNEEQLKNIESLVLEDKVAEYLENKSKVDEEELSFEEVVSMG